MSLLIVMPEAEPGRELLRTEHEGAIRDALKEQGIAFERWEANANLDGVTPENVLAAYSEEVGRWMKEGGYQSADVVRLAPNPADMEGYRSKAAAARAKFLEEHTHAEDEVRFFVEGSGVFYLHVGARVYALLCEQGDFVSVPARTAHWFDMGTEPHFTAIRIFTNPEGWVAEFTGNPIGKRFPTYDAIQASRSTSAA